MAKRKRRSSESNRQGQWLDIEVRGKEMKAKTEKVDIQQKIQHTNGKYLWTYAIPLLTNFTFLSIIAKAVLLSLAPVYLLLIILDLIEGNFERYFMERTLLMGGLMLLMLGLILIAWLVYVIVHKNRYIVIYEVDKKGILFVEARTTAEKSDLLAQLGMVAGALSGQATLSGASLLATTRHSYYTKFANIKQIIIKRNHFVVKARGIHTNVVYFYAQDQDELLEFILDHCPESTYVKEK